MEFWTILMITYGMGGPTYADHVVLPNPQVCGEEMLHMDTHLRPHFPDMMLQCIATDTPSKSIRPKKRPEDLK